jgi:hypothetical protein
MSIDLKSEVERAEFLDWIENNKNNLIEYLILDEEEFLLDSEEDFTEAVDKLETLLTLDLELDSELGLDLELVEELSLLLLL